MDLFKQDPLAPASTVKEKPLPQMRRNAPLVKFPKEDSLAKKGMQLASDEAIKQGMEGAKGYFTDAEGNMSLSNLKEDYAGAKDYLNSFLSPTDPTAGTASSLANQTAMTEAAGLTGAEMAAGAGSQLATGAGTELAAAKMAEQAGLNALVSSGGTGAATAATTGAAGAGGAAALGAAVPYIGAGLLAAKAFGLFSEGGKAGPLYAARGDKAEEEDEGFFQGLANSVSDATDYVMGKGRAGEKSKEFLQGYRSQGGPMYAGMGMLAMADKMKEKEMMPGVLGVAQQYMSSGDLVGPLALRKIKYKQDGGRIEVEATMGD